MNPEPAKFPSIKTEISDFCQEFAQILTPFEQAIKAARSEAQGKPDSDSLQRPLAGLSDVHHRLETLIHKVEEQQAYVIIFGPLKSGKSTLMNAISATYVSEVTSLPAYPCLVHVKHGEDYKFVVSRYNGEKISYVDNRSLQMLIQESHQALAERIREVEEAGEEFDPGVHCPKAIRRVDVEVPATNLKESLTVLVDTPGLYTRMKFGYNLMTREFQNSAACAVFVVKTDNLFLEQVFDEFNDLLDLFSRIFLVVNIDTNKRDLESDGSFKPSLESESPQSVIKAFESLVMSAPLRKAAEEGRLRIYPIDLLNSAAASLRQTNGMSSPAVDTTHDLETGTDGADEQERQTDAATDSPEPEQDGALEATAKGSGADANDHPVHSFSVFLKDLTEYLNSNDYLHEFMGDSLHLGKTLATEMQAHCSSQSMESFRERQASLRREAKEATARLEAVTRLEALDWLTAVKRLRQENREGAKRFADTVRQEGEAAIRQRLDDWFQSNESVARLQEDWNAIFEESRKRVETDCRERARSLVADSFGGIEINTDLKRTIENLDQILEPALRSARSALESATPKIGDARVDIQPDDLKVRKGFLDWILFRSLAAVRRRLFGEPGLLDKEVPAEVKQKRFGEEGKAALGGRALGRMEILFPDEAVRVAEELVSKYVEILGEELRRKLQSGKSEYTRKKNGLDGRLHDNQRIQDLLDGLSRQSGEVVEAIYSVREKYQAVNWEAREAIRSLNGAENEAGLREEGESPEAGSEENRLAAGEARPTDV